MRMATDRGGFEGIIKRGDLYILNAQGNARFNPGPNQARDCEAIERLSIIPFEQDQI